MRARDLPAALAAALAATAALAIPPSVAAEDAEWSRAGAYACSTLGGLAPSPGELAVRLRTPAAVAPGATLEGSGRLQVTLSSGAPALAGLVTLARSVRLVPGTIGLPVRVATAAGPVERIVALRDVRPEPTAIPGLGEPLVLGAAIALPPIVLPSDASGDVEILLPRDGTASADGSGSDDSAFTGMLRFDGGLLRDAPLACRVSGAPDGIVARIPIAPARATPTATTTATTPATTTERAAPTGDGPTGDGRDAGSPTTGPTPPAGTAPAAGGGAADEDGAAPPTDAEAGAAPEDGGGDPFVAGDAERAAAWSPVPPATRLDEDVLVPAWVLGVLLVALLATAGRAALAGRRRLREATIEKEQR